LIFFDLDGTLLDHDYADKKGILALYNIHADLAHVDENEFYHVYKEVMEHYFDKYLTGELTFEEQRRIRMIELFSRYRIKLTREEADCKFQLYLQSFEQNWQCYDDVENCLLSLNHAEKGIITNGNHGQQLQKLKNLGILQHFALIITSDEIGIAKPDKRIFVEACRRANKRTDACIYVGDRLHTDALSSKEAGMRGIWLNRNHETAAEEVEVIHSLSELSALIDLSL
jgi:putative hydrolase of the HAD superfamily